MINKLEIFCVTNKHFNFFEKTNYKLAAVGKDKLPDQYIRCDTGENIFYKEKNCLLKCFKMSKASLTNSKNTIFHY